MDSAGSQTAMNLCAASYAKKADAELDRVYKKILDLVKNDPVAIDKIRQAENAWIKFRDAQIEMKYPPREEGYYGTVHPMCVNLYYQALTDKRIAELKEWLKGTAEGNVCAGTIPINQQ